MWSSSNPSRRTLMIAAFGGVIAISGVSIGRAAAPGSSESSMSVPVVETVTFKLMSGVDQADFGRAQAAVNAFLSTQPGFVSRTLVRSKDGVYIDVVVWSSGEQAEAAAAKAMTEPALATFMQAIDPASMDMRHNEVVTQYP